MDGHTTPVSGRVFKKERQKAMRHDPLKTAARYDEIIALRMLLLDVLEADFNIASFTKQIKEVGQKR